MSEAGPQDAGASRDRVECPRGEKPSTHGGGERWVKLSGTAGSFIRGLEWLLRCNFLMSRDYLWMDVALLVGTYCGRYLIV